MRMSGPVSKVGAYLLLMGGIALGFRLINHAWPPVFLLGIVGGFSYYLWHKEQALEERVQLDRLQEEEEARRGKHGPRHYRA